MRSSLSLRALVVAVATTLGTGSVLATSYAAPPPQEQDFEQSYVTANVNVRSGPSASNRVVNRLKRGDFVNVGECRGSWCYVDVHGGNGWISGRFIGRGANPYHSRGPAGPGIPLQEPGTYDRGPVGRY